MPIASSALATTCAARARCMSSAALASSSSAWARMMPSWLFRRWKRRPQFGRLVHRSPREQFLDAQPARHQAWFRSFSRCHIACDRRTIGAVRVAPQRVDEDADRAAGGADVFDLAADESQL